MTVALGPRDNLIRAICCNLLTARRDPVREILKGCHHSVEERRDRPVSSQ
jgi:hypothetical protein